MLRSTPVFAALALLSCVSGPAPTADVAPAPPPALASSPFLKLCPTDAHMCAAAAMTTTKDELAGACAAKVPGACISLAWSRAVTRPVRKVLAESRATLGAACDAGEHAACALAVSVAGDRPQRVGEVSRKSPVLEDDFRYGDSDAQGKQPVPTQTLGGVPSHERLLAACTAGEPAACGLAQVEDAQVTAAYAAACQRGDPEACARPDGQWNRKDATQLVAARDAGSLLALALWVDTAESGLGRANALASVPTAAKLVASACAEGHPDACDLYLLSELPGPPTLDLRPFCRAEKVACSELRPVSFLRDLDCKEAKQRCRKITIQPTAIDVATDERACADKNKYACDDVAKTYAKGSPEVERDLDEARRLAKLGCDSGVSTACDVLRSLDPNAPAVRTVSLEECRERTSCDLFKVFAIHPEKFRQTAGLRKLLMERCPKPEGAASCDLLALAQLKGIDGPRDVADALDSAERGCVPYDGHRCHSLKPLLDDPETRDAASRLACLMGVGTDCETKGLLLAGPGVPMQEPVEDAQALFLDGHVLLFGKETITVHEATTGRRVGEPFRWLPEPTSLKRGAVDLGTTDTLKRVVLAESASGPVGFLELDRKTAGTTTPLAIALGPGFAMAELEVGKAAVHALLVDSSNRKLWTVLVDKGSRRVVAFDLVTGRPVGTPLEFSGVDGLSLAPDGKTLFVSTMEGQFEVDTTTGTSKPLEWPKGVVLGFSTDGKRAFTFFNPHGSTTEFWSPRPGETITRVGGTGGWPTTPGPLPLGRFGVVQLYDTATLRAVSVPVNDVLRAGDGYVVRRGTSWSWHGPKTMQPAPTPAWVSSFKPLPPAPAPVLPETKTRTFTFKVETSVEDDRTYDGRRIAPLAKVRITGTPVAEYATNPALKEVAARVKPWSGVTDAKGELVLKNVPRARFRVEATLAGFTPITVEALDFDDERPKQPYGWILSRPLRVKGVARTPDGKPVAGLTVKRKPNSDRDPPEMAVTDATGTFEFEIHGYQYGTEVTATTTEGVTLQAKGDAKAPIDLLVPPRTHAEVLRFKVVGESGRPISGAFVEGAMTDAEGRAALWSPATRGFHTETWHSFDVKVTHATGLSTHVELGGFRFSDNGVVIDAPRQHENATEAVVDGLTEYVVKVPDASITVDVPDLESWTVRRFEQKMASSRYHDPELNGGWEKVAMPLRWLPAGTYRLNGLAQDGRRFSTKVDVKAGEQASVKPEIVPGRRVAGRLVETNGKPITGMLVASSRSGIKPVKTDTDGRFVLEGVPSWTHVGVAGVKRDEHGSAGRIAGFAIPAGVADLGNVTFDDTLAQLETKLGGHAFVHELDGKLRLFVSRRAPPEWLDLFGPLARGGNLPMLDEEHDVLGFVVRSVDGEAPAPRMSELDFIVLATRTEVATLVVEDVTGKPVEVKVPRGMWLDPSKW